MASRIFLLCLLVSCLTVNYTECRRGGSSRGRSHGRSGGGFFGFGSSSHSHSSGSHWGSSSSSSHSYPSSSSGLSGSGSHGYGYGHHSYPSSSSGLSGYGSNSHTYPSSSSGLSGYGSGSKYPSSGSTWHFGSSSSSSSSHGYPSSSSGLSGSGTSYRPTSNHHYYHTNVGHSSHPPTYYSTPQYVYVQDYRNSDSRYGDLLTGLSLYNLGRSHRHYHNHYYYDDYYRHRYGGSSSYIPQDKPQDEANCVLKVKENGREDALKIPCEIVSTFTQDSKKVALTQQTQVNTTKCTTTITNKPVTTTSTTTTTTAKPFNVLTDNFSTLSLDELMAYANSLGDMKIAPNGSIIMPPMPTRRPPMTSFTFSPTEVVATSRPPVTPVTTVTTETSSVNGTVSYITKTVTTNATTVNETVCTTKSSFVDPLSAKGSPVDANNMECAVEIQTKDAFLRNDVDCKTLIKYAKMPEPQPDTGILPPREKLKSWLDQPPWWMSLFIAV